MSVALTGDDSVDHTVAAVLDVADGPLDELAAALDLAHRALEFRLAEDDD